MQHQSPPRYDVIIIGGGPAGASCALWLKMLGFRPLILEKRHQLGGLQNQSPYLNEWIATSAGLTGQQIAKAIEKNILDHGIDVVSSTDVVDVRGELNNFVVSHTKGICHANFVVLATGVHPADGGFTESSNILIGPGEHVFKHDFDERSVAILGGGDNAFENYAFAKQKGAANVHIHARSIRARKSFLMHTPPDDVFLGNVHIEAEKCEVNGRRYDVLLVLYGWKPNLGFMQSLLPSIDDKGFVVTNPSTAETSIPGLFAIGEVAHRMHPCCVTGMADGVQAAKAIQTCIEGDAVKDFLLLAQRIDRAGMA